MVASTADRSSLHQRAWSYFATDQIRGPLARALFADLSEQSPVLQLDRFWIVSSADVIRRIAVNPNFIMPQPTFPAPTLSAYPRFVEFFGRTLSFREGADHRRLRSVLAPTFATRAVNGVAAEVAAIVEELLDSVTGQGEIDLVERVTDVLPMRVTARALGVPESEWAWLEQAGRGMLAVIGSSFPGVGTTAQPLSNDGFAQLREYAERLVLQPSRPGTLADDVYAAVRAGQLDTQEAVDLALLLFMTGIDTVSAAIANCVNAILDRPATMEAVERGELGVADVFAEATRLDTPLPFVVRAVTTDVELMPGVALAPGDAVMLCLGGANLDVARFIDPLAWLPGQRPASLTFGHGIHHCVGAALATVQAQALVSALLGRGISRGAGDAVWRSDLSFHAVRRLPVRIGEVGRCAGQVA